jgi:hypothetical protein
MPILWIGALPLLLYGVWRRARRSNLVIEAFCVLHTSIVLLWPTPQELRFLYPVLPLFLLYVGWGFEALLARVEHVGGRRAARVLGTGCTAAILVVYAVRTTKVVAAEQPLDDGPYTPAAVASFEFIRGHTDGSATFLFFRPRALALYAQRRAAVFPYGQSPAVTAAYLNEIAADYVVLKEDAIDSASTGAFVYNQAATAFVRRCAGAVQLVFQNGPFRVYHLDRSRLSACSGERDSEDGP